MKKIIYSILAIALVFSCQDQDDHGVTVNDYNGLENVTYFTSGTSATYFVSPGAGNFNITIGSTGISDVDRTYDIVVDASSTAVEGNEYLLPSTTATIPAGSYFGDLSVQGIPDGATEAGSTLVLTLSGSDSMEGSSFTLSIVKSCPLDADFTGNYLIEQITPYIDGPTFDDGSVVTVYTIDGGNEFQRGFMTPNFTDYCSTPNEFIFELNCGNVLVPTDQSCNCSCAGNYFFGAPDVPSTYTYDNDGVFELTFTDDVTNDCGASAQTTYRFTKQ